MFKSKPPPKYLSGAGSAFTPSHLSQPQIPGQQGGPATPENIAREMTREAIHSLVLAFGSYGALKELRLILADEPDLPPQPLEVFANGVGRDAHMAARETK